MIEDTTAFITISALTIGAMNVIVNWGARRIEWVPSHSICASGIAGGLAGLGNGLTLSTLAFFPKSVNQFWKREGLQHARQWFLMKLVMVFAIPFFTAILFTQPVASLFGREISMSTTLSYGVFDGTLCLFNYYLMKR